MPNEERKAPMFNKLGKKRKITFWTRLGFGFGGMLNSGALTFTHSYMVMFLSTECGLSGAEAAAVAAAAVYLNAFLAPVLGFIADNFYSTAVGRKFGRRRFWLLIAIPMMIAEPLIFTVTPFGFPYYLALYIIYNVAYTFASSNLSPLTIEMTDDYQERTYLTGYKHIFGNVSGFLMATLVGFGFGLFGETGPRPYFIIASINAAIMAVSLIIVYCSTWEHSPEEVAQEKITGVGEAVKKLVIDILSTFRNRSFRKVLAPYAFMKLAAACWSACLSFFIVYSLGIAKSYEAVMEMPGKIVAIVCTVVWVAWMAKKGFHQPWYIATLGAAACIFAYNFFAAGHIMGSFDAALGMIAYPIIFAIWKFFYVGFQYLLDVPLNYMPDIDELITLRRREGIYSAAQKFVDQIVSAFATSAWAFVLGACGFIKSSGNSADIVQPTSVPVSICAFMLIGCAGCFIVACILGKTIHIDKKQCDMLCDEVKRVKEGGLMADVDPEVKTLCEDLSGFKYEECFGHNNVGYQEGTVKAAA
jgi:oligogalacturonide transporter